MLNPDFFKKIVAFLFCLTCIISCAFAQYSYQKIQCLHQNPGGLNTDIEEPGTLFSGWTILADSSSVPAWSNIDSIPFSFNLNGNNFNRYKVSTVGVLTFDTAAVTLAGSVNFSLPNSQIPNNSICVWGINAGESNDNIASKTFGIAPNRQHWIWFNSFSIPGASGLQFSYWAIVLEETSNKIYLVDQRTFPAGILSLTLGIQLNGGSAVEVSGSPNIDGLATANSSTYDGIADNVYYVFSNTPFSSYDAHINSMLGFNDFPYRSLANFPFTFSGEFINLGSQNLDSAIFNYSINGGPAVASPYVQVNSPTGTCFVYTHPTTWSPASSGQYSIKIWASLLDGNNDQQPADDTLTTQIIVYSDTPSVHKVTIEAASGTSCGWSPGDAVFLDSISKLHPYTTTLISVHGGDFTDPMKVQDYEQGLTNLGCECPFIAVNRKSIDNPANIFMQYTSHIGDFALADISLTRDFDAGTRICTVTASVKPTVSVSGDYRLACVFSEDDVSGNDASWSQQNYYSFSLQNISLSGAGHNWQQESGLVPFNSMKYDFTARTILGGFTGEAGSLPSSMTAGTSYPHAFTFEIPATSNELNMKAHVLLLDVSANAVLNSNSVQVATTGISDSNPDEPNIHVYPNPAIDVLYIRFTTEKPGSSRLIIQDLAGREILSKNTENISSEEQIISLKTGNLASGVYLITISTEQFRLTKKFVK